MRRRTSRASLLVTTVVLLSLPFGIIMVLPENAMATTRYVGGGGPGNYTTIQAAVDAAFPGDTVYVYNGTYQETVSIAKTLSLIGEDLNTTTIDTMGGGDAIHISSSWVNVTGFTMMNSGTMNGQGIELTMVKDCYIANNSVKPNFIDGILLWFTSGNWIVNNTVRGNVYGIDLALSSNERILNNTVVDNTYGVYVMGSSTSTIKGNTMVGNSIYMLSVVLSELNTHTIDTLNTVNGKPVYYWKDLSGGNVPPGAGEVIIVNCTDVIVENQNVSGGTVGMFVSHSANITLSNNMASNGLYGIQVFLTQDSTLSHNNASRNQYAGIELQLSPGNTFLNNTALSNTQGFMVSMSSSGTFTGNTASGNTEGFYVLDSDDGTFSFNNATMNTGSGILLSSAERNNITNCFVSGNNLAGISLSQSSQNTIQANAAWGNSYGVLVQNSRNIGVVNNTLWGNVYGVSGKNLNDIVIGDNAVVNNTIALALRDSRNVTVHRNNVSGLMDGIDLVNVNESTVFNNTSLHNRWDAIRVGSSSNVTVEGNTIWESRRGIWLDYSTRTTVTDNTMVRAGIVMDGRSLQHWNTHTIETSNAVNGRPAYYWKDAVGGTVPFGAGQVILANCSGVEVRDQNVSNASAGIQLGFSSWIIIVNNAALSNPVEGIRLSFSDNSTVIDNMASSNRSTGVGVFLQYSNNNSVTGNMVSTGWFGILASYSRGNVIRGNDVSVSEYGLELGDSSFNTVSENDVHDNDIGIVPRESVNSTFEDNAVHDNYLGFWVRQSNGNVIRRNNVSANTQGISFQGSYGNRIYHNVFYGNTGQAHDNTDANQWDDGYPSGGNYWSDYAGVDVMWGPSQNLTGSDGMGDTPYEIDSDSQDRYPLMFPYVPPARPTASDARLSGNGRENVTLEWLLSPDDGGGYDSIVGYEIYRGTTYDGDGLGYELIASVANGTSAFTDALAGEGDPNTYFYVVCAVDRDNRTACAQDQAAKFTRPLAPGPNLISIPLIRSNKSIQHVPRTVKYDNAWYYDSSSGDWHWHMRDKTYSGWLSGLNHAMGIWVNVTEASNFTVAGIVPPQTTVQLFGGWNLVSYPSINATYTVADLKAETGATRVEGYDPAPPYFLRVLGDAEVLQAGYGYWVRVEADTVWTVWFA